MDDVTRGKEEARRVLEEKYKRYKKLPPENITDEEWNVFFDVLRDHLNKKDIMNDYINAIHVIMERALFYASVKQSKDFNINHLTRALEELVAFNIFRDEIRDMKKEVNSYLDPNSKEYAMRKLVEKAMNKECEMMHLKKPDYISIKDWLTALDILEAHYMANDMMKNYLTNMYWFVRTVTFYATPFDRDNIAGLFSKVNGSTGILNNYDNYMRFREGDAISEEFEEKIGKHRKKEKKIVKK